MKRTLKDKRDILEMADDHFEPDEETDEASWKNGFLLGFLIAQAETLGVKDSGGNDWYVRGRRNVVQNP